MTLSYCKFVVNIAKKDSALCVIFSCDFLKIIVDIFEYQAYNIIKDKGNNKYPLSQINQLFYKGGFNYETK